MKHCCARSFVFGKQKIFKQQTNNVMDNNGSDVRTYRTQKMEEQLITFMPKKGTNREKKNSFSKVHMDREREFNFLNSIRIYLESRFDIVLLQF